MAALKALVIIMAVLIVAGLAALVWGITQRGSDAAADLGEVSLGLPEGCRIAEASATDRRLVVRADGALGCDRVTIIDLATGAIVGAVTP